MWGKSRDRLSHNSTATEAALKMRCKFLPRKDLWQIGGVLFKDLLGFRWLREAARFGVRLPRGPSGLGERACS